MLTTHWKPEKLFFFDKDKKLRWRKRQKKSADSLPITLLREARPSVTFAGDRLGNIFKNKKENSFVKGDGRIEEEGENSVADGNEKKVLGKKHKLINELEYDEDEDTQRFLYEEARFSAPNLLAQIEKFIILLLKKRTNEKEELDQLSEEIEAIYGSEWDQGLQEDRRTVLYIPDDLYTKLCCDYEQFAEGAVYVMRKWQTNVYRELAALQELKSSHNFIDFQSLTSSPDLALLRTLSREKQKVSTEEREGRPESNKPPPSSDVVDGKSTVAEAEMEGPPITNIGRESRISGGTFKPKTRLDKFKVTSDRDKGPKAPSLLIADKERQQKGITGAKISVGPHESFEDEFVSVKGWETNFEKSIVSNQNQTFLPGSILNFSLASKACHDKGWVLSKHTAEDLEQKSMLEWMVTRLRQSLKQRDEEEDKAKLLNENGPLIKRDYGDAKRETTIKYKRGVAWAKFLSQKQTVAPKRFLTTLPDGSTCCLYPSLVPRPKLFSLMIFPKVTSQVESLQSLPSARQDGVPDKKWKWAYGKMMNPETVQISLETDLTSSPSICTPQVVLGRKLNENISVRCVSHNSVSLTVNIEGEVHKFHVSPFQDASETDTDNLGYLMTNENFTSRGAAEALPPRKKITREERRAKNQKRDLLKNNNPGLSEESLAERLKDLDEKFPERRDIELDAPFLIELHKLQRRIRNIVFEWMDYYRSSVGISRPSKISLLSKKKNRMNSANSLPGSLPSFPRKAAGSLQRAPSAPPLSDSSRSKFTYNGEKLSQRDRLSARERTQENRPRSNNSGHGSDEVFHTDLKLEVPQLPKSADTGRLSSSASPAPKRGQTEDSPRPKTNRPLLLPKEGCPYRALHAEMIGVKSPQCRCDKRKIPCIQDLEYDVFINQHVPSTQLIVVSIVSSWSAKSPSDTMLDELYYEKNKAQNLPCAQSRNDPYRILRYDLASAGFNNETPLLLRRHNVAPGMFLMYVGGKLLFADYIFNGYGNAKKDFLNQVLKTRKDSMVGAGLAQDFRFSTRPTGREPRTAWGSELALSFGSVFATTDEAKNSNQFVFIQSIHQPSLLNECVAYSHHSIDMLRTEKTANCAIICQQNS
eukprot:gene2467-18125_t